RAGGFHLPFGNRFDAGTENFGEEGPVDDGQGQDGAQLDGDVAVVDADAVADGGHDDKGEGENQHQGGHAANKFDGGDGDVANEPIVADAPQPGEQTKDQRQTKTAQSQVKRGGNAGENED